MSGQRLADTRTWARAVVRSGLMPYADAVSEVASVIAVDHREVADPSALAQKWCEAELTGWRDDAAGWPVETEFARLQAALSELSVRGFLVLQGCADHWAAREALQATPQARGVLWFTAPDVWHAIDEPMLEVNLWHPSGANAAEDDDLLHEVLVVVRAHGVEASFDEGRIEARLTWQFPAPV